MICRWSLKEIMKKKDVTSELFKKELDQRTLKVVWYKKCNNYKSIVVLGSEL